MVELFGGRIRHYTRKWSCIVIIKGAIHLAKKHIHTNDNAVGMLTKSVTLEKFECCLDFIDVTLCGGDIATLPPCRFGAKDCVGLVQVISMLVREYGLYFLTMVDI